MPPFDAEHCSVPFENLHACEDFVVLEDSNDKVPVDGFCALKAAINRINRVECAYYGPRGNGVDVLDDLTTPMRLRGLADYVDRLATLLDHKNLEVVETSRTESKTH